MEDIIIYDSKLITVKYLADHRTIYHVVHQPVDGQLFRDAINAGTEALKMYGACKWISDDRKNGPLSQENREWGFNDWNPRAMKAGWKYWANVVPTELIAAGSLAPTIEDLYKLGLRMMVFSSVKEAMDWLDSMPG